MAQSKRPKNTIMELTDIQQKAKAYLLENSKTALSYVVFNNVIAKYPDQIVPLSHFSEDIRQWGHLMAVDNGVTEESDLDPINWKKKAYAFMFMYFTVDIDA
jgi:hypothetical protein